MGNIWTFFLSGLVQTETAWGCPLCHTTTAEEVRAGILATGQDGLVLTALAGPFLLMGIALAAINKIFPGAPEKNESEYRGGER